MAEWWPAIGETSIALGSALGFAWALVSTSMRRRRFGNAAVPPVGQVRWFLLNFVSMTCYLTLTIALGLASLHDILPQTLFWFLLGLSAVAFVTALMFPAAMTHRAASGTDDADEPLANHPLMPARKSA